MLITLSGTMVISCLVNIVQGGGGEVLPRFGVLENSQKTVKCVITFETDCSFQACHGNAIGFEVAKAGYLQSVALDFKLGFPSGPELGTFGSRAQRFFQSAVTTPTD